MARRRVHRRGRLQISREPHDSGFAYFQHGQEVSDPEQLERITALAIPPAWHDVEISASASAKVLARGTDDAGRRQAIYNPSFRRRRDAAKFNKMAGFGQALPTLRRQVAKDLRLSGAPEAKVVACVVKLMDQRYLRVGNPEYAKRYHSYGVTTLRRRHAKVTSSTLVFEFTGKSGQPHRISIEDSELASLVGKLKDMPGHEIFRFIDEDQALHSVQGRHVNDYLKRYLGSEYSAKDFRTWGGTLTALEAILDSELDSHTSKTQSARIQREAVGYVAEVLGNTVATARGSYIDPRVLALAEDAESVGKLRVVRKRLRPRKYLSVDEQCLLKVLDS